MSQENVETVRRIYKRVSASMEWPAELFDADFESDMHEVWGVGALRFDATLEALREYFGTFEGFHVEMEELIHADGGTWSTRSAMAVVLGAVMTRSGTTTSTSGPSAMARSFGSRST